MQFTPHAVLHGLAGTLALVAARYLWRRREARGAVPFLVVALAAAEWAWVAAAGLCFSGYTEQLWFLRLYFAGIVTLGPAWFVFALRYTGRGRWLTPPVWIVLASVPLVTLALLYTNDSHHLMYTAIVSDGSAGFARLVTVRGPWFWVHTSFQYGLVLGSGAMILLSIRDSPSPYRLQFVSCLASMGFPLAANILQVTGTSPSPVDPTPLAFGLGAASFVFGMFRYRLLDVMPVARSLVVEGLADGVLVLDAQDRIVDANPAAVRLLSACGIEFVGRSIAEAFAHHPQVVAEAFLHGAAESEVRVATGGVCKHFALRSSPIPGAGEANSGRVIVARDITERVRCLEELDAYARAVAHDLQNPVSVVSGYVDLLASSPEANFDADQRRWIEGALRGCEQMSRIIESLLLLAQTRNDSPVPVAPIAMAGIVGEVAGRFAGDIAAAHGRVAIDAHWPSAAGYAPWVEEVWANYLSNAIKYGGTPPQIELGGEIVAERTARFWVRDHGPGLTREQQSRLFREFSRLHSGASGHGLGLALVSRIVQRLGGTTGVDSAPGRGSTFWFTLPTVPAGEGCSGVS